MKNFLDDNFLLKTKTAQDLYHNHAAKMPIIDYHCHLDPRMVAEDHKFGSITEIWLGGDHYKWRAMRANGVNEKYCTGSDTSDWEKFEKWAETVPYTMRNPLYHWTHLELKTAFGIDKILSPRTAKEIFDECNEKIKSPDFSAQGLMRKYNVKVVCTTDDPVDSLEYHIETRKNGFEIKMLPTWRPDKAMAVETPELFRQYVDKLAQVSNTKIASFDDLIIVLRKRHDFFAEQGCKLSDHGIEEFYAEDYTGSEIKAIFSKVYGGAWLTKEEILKFKSAMMIVFGEMDAEKGWTQQFHYGAIRNNNAVMFKQLGADTGFDSIGEFNTAKAMSKFFDKLNTNGKLTKTILYNLNPCANEVIATMTGNFQDGEIAGKMQFGSAWWFLDQKDGMEKQMNTLSVLGLLSRFVGMLTDSRSFLSYPRHEYFRRTLCNLLGNDVENGELPSSEIDFIKQMVENISYNNAKNFFRF
jgi:glucuronate isomerase